jgi:hypothetical protein
MVAAVLLGHKHCTSRRKKYGEVGDIFFVSNGALKSACWCVLIAHTRHTVGYVADNLYRLEGFDSPGAFRSVWREIHPRKGCDDLEPVWVHWFEMVV